MTFETISAGRGSVAPFDSLRSLRAGKATGVRGVTDTATLENLAEARALQDRSVAARRCNAQTRVSVPQPRTTSRTVHDRERGFTLAALIVVLTILSMVIAYSVPPMWSNVMKRERDIQTIFVMKQYTRAIAEFQKKHNSPPVSMEQLHKQTSPRVLRAKWVDPLTGKDDWILVAPAQVPPTGPSTPQSGSKPIPPSNQGGQYVGPFVGVRPPVTGQSFLSLNGQDRYENWVYTVADLTQELNPNQGPTPPGAQPTPTKP